MAAYPDQALPTWRDGPIVRRVLSVDHKQIGVFYLAAAGLFLVGLGIARLLWFLDAAHAPAGLLDLYSQRQVLAFEGTTVLFHVALPATLGLAVYLVPLQIGARSIASPQLSALAFWLYLAGASMMLVAFAAGDPSDRSPAVPLSPQGRQVWLTGLIVVAAGSALTAAVLLETLRSRRAAGMTLARVPLFSFAAGAYAVALLVAMAIAAAIAAVYLVDADSARSFLVWDAFTEGSSFYQVPAWFFGNPLTFAVFAPISAGVIEALATLVGHEPAAMRSGRVAAALVAVLAVLVAVYHLVADSLGASLAEGFPLAGFILLGPLAFAALAVLLELRALRGAPRPETVLALGMVAVLVVGAALGFALGFPGDYKLSSPGYHLLGYFDGTLGSAAFLGLTAGVLYWFPKVTGRLFDERAARSAAGLLVPGALCVAAGSAVAGEGDLATWSSAAKVGLMLALAGYLLMFLGGAQLLAAGLFSARFGIRVGNDPWRADTLEWYAASPPAPHNFDHVPPVSSDRPLRDLRERAIRGNR